MQWCGGRNFFETSAKDGTNVKAAFHEAAMGALNKISSDEFQIPSITLGGNQPPKQKKSKCC